MFIAHYLFHENVNVYQACVYVCECAHACSCTLTVLIGIGWMDVLWHCESHNCVAYKWTHHCMDNVKCVCILYDWSTLRVYAVMFYCCCCCCYFSLSTFLICVCVFSYTVIDPRVLTCVILLCVVFLVVIIFFSSSFYIFDSLSLAHTHRTHKQIHTRSFGRSLARSHTNTFFFILV